MQLTSILLYESLKEQFHIADYRLLSKNQPLARPFFYEADRGLLSDHIYLTEENPGPVGLYFHAGGCGPCHMSEKQEFFPSGRTFLLYTAVL